MSLKNVGGHKALALATMMAAFGPTTAFAETLKVHGATTVFFGLMKPNKEKIEKASGQTLTLVPSSTSRGLSDLVQGSADIAMLAEPLESAADSMNKKTPGSVMTADYMGQHVGNAYIQFIVNPANPVQKLSKTQLAAILSGKINNWSELGGANLPFLLVGEPSSSPHKMISDELGISYSSEMRFVQNTNQTAVIVAQAPGAFSYITTAHDIPERSRLKVVETEVKIPLKLYLAYKKSAPDSVRKAVEATASAAQN
jgi:phosphate transport system substrate-binding protein